MKKTILLLVFIISTQGYTQIKKFGKVSVAELKSTECTNFKDANAAVLFKHQKTHYEYDGERGWLLITKIHERIKIYNKEGYEFASKKINFYNTSKSSETVMIKANTYNLVNNKIEKTKLKNKEIFISKNNKFWSSKKFTMPNLKDNCIVEWEYKIISPYHTTINDVIFQYTIPILYIESTIKIPEYYLFNVNVSKYYPITVSEKEESRTLNFSFRTKETSNSIKTTRYTKKVELYQKIYAIKETNIPPISNEPYINNINNYIGKISFELNMVKFPNSIPKFFTTNWNDVTKTIYNLSEFGDELNKKSYYKKELDEKLTNVLKQDERIKTIFNFVKEKVKWNGYMDYYTHNGVKKAYKNGSGNVAEINLMLVSMLREAGFDANPILVSTRSHGVPFFATRDGFNYVIAGIELPEKLILLDATEKYSSINNLPKRVLNWQGRIIRKSGSSTFIDLFPKVYSFEKNTTSVILDELGNIKGNARISYKNLNAINYRNSYSNLNNSELISRLENYYSPIEIEKAIVRNENNLDKPFLISFKFSAENQGEVINNKMYFSPLFFLNESENIFKADKRKLPIDFASPWLDNYTIIITIPNGYKIESIPESSSFETKNKIANFKYSITSNDNKISVKVTTKVHIPIIPTNMYEEFRNFYSKRVKKINEKIVLIKD